jgi:hypothetical protein
VDLDGLNKAGLDTGKSQAPPVLPAVSGEKEIPVARRRQDPAGVLVIN